MAIGVSEHTTTKKATNLAHSDMYRVILVNDDYTTMEFVVEIIIKVFGKSPIEATKIMLQVHQMGKGTVGVYSYDIATTKATQVHALAKQYEYPLRCKVEKV